MIQLDIQSQSWTKKSDFDSQCCYESDSDSTQMLQLLMTPTPQPCLECRAMEPAQLLHSVLICPSSVNARHPFVPTTTHQFICQQQHACGTLGQGFPNCVPWHISVRRKRLKYAVKVSCFDKKLIKCLVNAAVGFCHHKIGVLRKNPEVISVP